MRRLSSSSGKERTSALKLIYLGSCMTGAERCNLYGVVMMADRGEGGRPGGRPRRSKVFDFKFLINTPEGNILGAPGRPRAGVPGSLGGSPAGSP